MLRLALWILLLAAVVYAVFWLIDRRNGKGRGDGGRGGGLGGFGGFGGLGGGPRPSPPAPKGPDDDEEFLRDLEWRRQREARRRAQGGTTDEGDEPGPRSDQSDTSGGTEPPYA